MAKILKTTNEERQEIMRRSVLSLADRPSEYGQKPVDIKRAQTAPIFGSDHSVLHELDRVVDAINALLNGSTESEATISTTAQTIVGAINELRGKIASEEYVPLDTNAQDLQGAVNELWGICDVMEAILNTASSEGNTENLVKRDENGRFEAATAISDSSAENYSEYFVANVKFVKDAVSALAVVVGIPTSENVGDSIVRRDANGKFKAGTPDGSSADDVATVGYISGAYGATKTAVENATADKTENTLVKRNASGRAKIAAPSGSDNDEIANVGYVGKKSDLETESKDTVVGAVNELKGRADTNASAISGVQAALAGYSRSYTCNDFDDIVYALAGSETLKDSSGASKGLADLKTGDMIYLKDTNAPDFWWQENAEASSTGAESYDNTELYVSGVGYLHKVEIDDSELQGYTEDAQAWAEGKRGAFPVSSGDPTYNNNAKYWAGESADSASAASDAASDASDSADAASDAADDAAGSATNASNSESAASNSATQASNHAKTAEAYALGTKNGEAVGSDDLAYQNNAKYYAEVVAPAEAEAVLANKANVDGFYENFTSGTAIVANTIARNVNSAIRETFLYRATGGSADIASESPAKYNYLEGKTWYENQLVKLRGTVTVADVTITNNGDGSITLNGTATDDNYLNLCDSSYPINYIEGHKYLLKGGVDTIAEISAGSSSITSTLVGNTPAIFTANSSASNGYIRVRIVNGTQYNSVRIFPELIDLTEWYCHEVPENLTVAQFQAEFGSKYIPCNAGIWRNALPSGIKTVNKNLLNLDRTEIVTSAPFGNNSIRNFNENQIWVGITNNNYFANNNIDSYSIANGIVTVTNIDSSGTSGYGIGFPMKCLPNTNYHKQCDNDVFQYDISFYDGNGQFILLTSANTFTTPSNAYWMLIVFAGQRAATHSYISPIVNLSYSSYNGIYEPHKSASFPFANLGTGLNKARNAVDTSWVVTETDGQTITYMQHVKTVVARVDLGTLDWSYNSTYGYCYSESLSLLIKAVLSNTDVGNLICAKYMLTSYYIQRSSGAIDKTISVNIAGGIAVLDSAYTDAASFKVAMSGVYLYYELAEPVETTYTLSADWSCTAWDLGTEEFTFGSGAAPVALTIKTLYNWNVNDFLKNVNKNFLGMTDGTLANLISALASAGFTVSATFDASQNHYTWAVTNDRVPALPSGDGTYKLVGTVSGGTKSYSWEAEQ